MYVHAEQAVGFVAIVDADDVYVGFQNESLCDVLDIDHHEVVTIYLKCLFPARSRIYGWLKSRQCY